MRTERIAAAATARGKENKRRVHLSVTGDELVPICGAQAMWGWTRRFPPGLKPCPRCETKAAKA